MASLPAFHSFNLVAAAGEDRKGGLEPDQAEKTDDIDTAVHQIPTTPDSKPDLKIVPYTATVDQITDAGHDKPQEVVKQREEVESVHPDNSSQSMVTPGSQYHLENGAAMPERNVESIGGLRPVQGPQTSDLVNIHIDDAAETLKQRETEKDDHQQTLQHDKRSEDTMSLGLKHQNTATPAVAASAQPAHASPVSQNNSGLGFTSVKSTQAAVLKSSQNDCNNSTDGAGKMEANDSLRSTSVKPAQTLQIKVFNTSQAEELVPSRIIPMGVVKLLIALAFPLCVGVIGVNVNSFDGPGQLFPTLLSNTLVYAAIVLVLLVPFIIVSATLLILENMGTKINTSINPSELSGAFYVYVLGSGGHTTEMMSLIRISHKPHEKTHRRYLITVGDEYSHVQCQLLEDRIGLIFPNGSAGTSDIACVSRARSVHESIGSSILSVLRSGQQIASILRVAPDSRADKVWKDRFADVIVTNGPGTGFIVALVVFIMKVFYIVPRDRLKVVFVETWARGHELSVTGRLFYTLKLANLFVVQSKELATAFDVPCIGNVNKIWAESPREKVEDGAGVASESGDEVLF